MRRCLGWSAVFHALVLLGGLIVAPIGGIFGHVSRPTEIITVGLVDFATPPKGQPVAMPSPPVPVPAADDAILLRPEKDLTLEAVSEPEPERPESVDEPPPDDDTKPDTNTALAQVDTSTALTGSISESDGIWGVETAPNVNPYHRRGFASIRAMWRNPIVGPTPRKCVVRFTVKRSGEIKDVKLEQSSGTKIFDEAAVRAVRRSVSWDEFPQFWKESEQIIHLEFEYRP